MNEAIHHTNMVLLEENEKCIQKKPPTTSPHIIQTYTRATAWHMPPIGTLTVGVWKIRLREKWNMVKIDDPQ
jgi:hypothetical protein